MNSRARDKGKPAGRDDQRPPASSKQPLFVLKNERAHFSFGAHDRDVFLARLAPTVKAYAKNGIRKPKDVSRVLNDDGVRTACNGRWTPRLTMLLLAMLFENPGSSGSGIWDRKPTARVLKPSPVRAKRSPPEHPKRRGKLKCRQAPKPVASDKIKPAPVVRARISPKAALAIIGKLPRMNYEELAGVWQNAIRIMADPGTPDLEDAARKVLAAIGKEWNRRLGDGNRPEDFFHWPSTDADGGDGNLRGGAWPSEGLLKFLGYAVGRTQGVETTARRLILAEIFQGHLPPIVSLEYMRQWAQPNTAGRLRKMAETIAALTRNAKRRDAVSLDDAIRDWERDLKFLYEKYYVGHFRFEWPLTAI